MSLTSNMFDDAVPMDKPMVTGKWCTIRVHPDIVTGEVINIGVAFSAARGQPLFRLIPNARGFECLYGPHGLEQYGFLLRAMQEHLAQAQKASDILPVSQQISLSPWRETAGNSALEIVEHLYARMVHINCNVADKPKADSYSVSTADFRTRVKATFAAEVTRQLFREDPVVVKAPDGKAHYLDMPVWLEKVGFFPRFTYGTMVSCHYKSDVYRKAALGPACQHMTVAIDHFAQHSGTGFLIALRPPDGAPGFSQSDFSAIENEIDDLTWPFQKSKQVRMHVAHSTEEAARLIDEIVS
jgi:hypothetical protein